MSCSEIAVAGVSRMVTIAVRSVRKTCSAMEPERPAAPGRSGATLASRFDRCIGPASILPFQRNAAVKSTGTLPLKAKVWEDSMDISKFGRRGIVSGALLAAASLVLGQPALVQPALAQAPKAPVV